MVLTSVVAEYDKRSHLIAKLVAAAESATDASERHERELKSVTKERDAAQAQLRREGEAVEQAKQAGKVLLAS